MKKFNNATDFELVSVKITPHGDEKGQPITKMVTDIKYSESITSPFVAMSLQVVDSVGMLQGNAPMNKPIQGGEKVEVQVLTSGVDETIVYEMVVWKVANRFVQNEKQSYTLGLISPEALNNEVMRVENRLEGNPESIIADLLQNKIKTSKVLYSEPARFEVKMLPNRRRPFDIFSILSTRSISPQSTYTTTSSTSESTSQTAQSIKGSAGFFFWESKRGYNFFAVDSLCADENSKLKSSKLESPAWGPYVEKRSATDDGSDTRYIIYKAVFQGEVDLIDSLRKGQYSSFIAFWNHSTGQYEEYVYKLKETYDNMAHLGGQESLSLIPSNQIELSEYPTKIMSILLDHETWYNDPGIASPDESDGSDAPTQFADWQKYYAAQAISRYKLLKNQTCSIVIPGNAQICAGDKIDIRLVNKVPSSEGKKNPTDKESSGVYLIEEVTHSYDPTAGANGKFETTLRLMRDSYGMKDEESKHGN